MRTRARTICRFSQPHKPRPRRAPLLPSQPACWGRGVNRKEEMQQVRFFNPVGSNDATASGPGAPGYKWNPQERFCMLGWHWVCDFRDDVIQTVLERHIGSDLPIQACQSCMRRWHSTGRVHIGTLTNAAVFWMGDFRPRHMRRIERWLYNRAPLLRDEKPNKSVTGKSEIDCK